jgi:hypothetical protein
MNNNHGTTPLNPKLDLLNRSTNLCKSFGIVGTPHGESIAMLFPNRLAKSRGIEEIPPRTPLTLASKIPKLSPLTHEFGRGIKGKRTMKG